MEIKATTVIVADFNKSVKEKLYFCNRVLFNGFQLMYLCVSVCIRVKLSV